jgi:NADH-quinone oxidoreductase subunit G
VISPQRAAALGVKSGDHLRISNAQGSITLAALVEDIHDDAVWLPRNSIGSTPLATLNAVHGDLVTVVKA